MSAVYRASDAGLPLPALERSNSDSSASTDSEGPVTPPNERVLVAIEHAKSQMPALAPTLVMDEDDAGKQLITSSSNPELDLERGVIVLGCTPCSGDVHIKTSCWHAGPLNGHPHELQVAAGRRTAPSTRDLDWTTTSAAAREYAKATGRKMCPLGVSYLLTDAETEAMEEVADAAVERARNNFVKKAFVRISYHEYGLP
ncbi:hypothetical protein EXIGLDRAFT_838583 [Exidia glandulosa HHB12029]|uniref:Uncharacterized protein n=1 Tax=Exidia glandulosa HHB12029 TaxID=1314781 RepID=A0A165FPH5_EXIGL|nr:hypothetical protein EXIGLDRAFT_838583 [Exidia glandulosa HHB12029]